MSAQRAPGVFISYRRSDTEGYAGRLFEGLVARFGRDRVFFDVTRIAPGQNFHQVIDNQLRASGALVVLIGKAWLDVADDAGTRRLANPEDSVRVEIAAALGRGIPIIPVLVQGATMPHPEQLPEDLRELAGRNAIELRHTRWEADVADCSRRWKSTSRRRRRSGGSGRGRSSGR